MNKFVILGIVLVLIIAGAAGYRAVSGSSVSGRSGETKAITITIEKNSWSFTPDRIEANKGDTLKLTFINEDDYDHGIGIDAYGVSQRVPARATLELPAFVVTKSGDFQFYCSVSCGEGIAETGLYKGEKRSHFDQIGILCVHDAPGDGKCTETGDPAKSGNGGNTSTLPEPK
jgi:plastocyanin